jgi:DNA-binding IclR family transcriptional regulator
MTKGQGAHDTMASRNGFDDPAAPSGTQLVSRVFDILDSFLKVGPRLTATDVSRSAGLKYATAHRILEAMVTRGVLDRDPDSRRYSVGQRLKAYGVGGADDLEIAHSILEDLTGRTGETSHLAVRDGSTAIYVDTVAGPKLLSAHRHVGRQMPIHSTGVGKALLSGLDDQELDGLLNGKLERFTPSTVVDQRRLLAQLREIRATGYAVDDEETEEGLICVAAPIRNQSGRVIAAISVGGPATRLRPIVGVVAAEVIQSAAELSRATVWTSSTRHNARDGGGS